MPLEGIPAASLERPDTALPNRPRDVSERCADPLLRHAVDRGEVPSSKLARHDIIDKGERPVGLEHSAGFDLQVRDGVPDLSSPVGRHRTVPISANSRRARD